MHESSLILGIAGLPPESARNCVQELFPIPSGEFKKSINGDLLFLETTERKRYKSIITCRDVNSPLVDRIWIGSQITLGCIQNLWQSIHPGSVEVQLIRPAVEGSICVVNNFGDPIKFSTSDNQVKLYKSYEDVIFVCFRPWLTMCVTDFSLETDEWKMQCGWKLVLEEI
ncbi:MAG: hypothetical protein LBT63_03490 [Holosporaceae bacterium]|jgi:hypothetical protein|nr:hypothetical protein [Holosporaceae bacterium]